MNDQASSIDTARACTVTWGDPVDLPVDDESAGLVIIHVPELTDTARHHQPSLRTYFDWIVEVIDDAERILETGGRLVLVVKHMERQGPLMLDLYPMLLHPLSQAGRQRRSGGPQRPLTTARATISSRCGASGPSRQHPAAMPSPPWVNSSTKRPTEVTPTSHSSSKPPSPFTSLRPDHSSEQIAAGRPKPYGQP
ncbi:MAG: hypothetical protein OER95_13120, partial [Acidimicrobiia bacterium]|nr:hypothetical protein [Acidimicrobiia bacterium]